MEKLISMTEFVLSKEIKDIMEFQSLMAQQSERTRLYYCISNYANFLNQPLKLGMFIPCDENDNVLKEPKRWKDYLEYPESFDGNKEWEELYTYQEAKERVLFEGFELIEISTNFNIVINQEKDCQVFANQYQNIYYKCNEFDKIEDLYKYNLTLTQTALKQIGINA